MAAKPHQPHGPRMMLGLAVCLAMGDGRYAYCFASPLDPGSAAR
jgi:hypothetical protein